MVRAFGGGGGIAELFFGSAFAFIPHDGQLLTTGLMVAWLFLGLAGAIVVGGLSATGAGIYNLVTARDSILRSETAFNSDKFAATANDFAGKSPAAQCASTNIERWEHSLLP